MQGIRSAAVWVAVMAAMFGSAADAEADSRLGRRTIPLDLGHAHRPAWEANEGFPSPVYLFYTHGPCRLRIRYVDREGNRGVQTVELQTTGTHTLKGTAQWESFEATCSGEGCQRPEARPADLIRSMDRSRLKKLLDSIERAFDKKVTDPNLRSKLLAVWTMMRLTGAWNRLDRFPVVPAMPKAGQMRPLLGGLANSKEVDPDEVIVGRLEDILTGEEKNFVNADPGPLHPEIPEVGYGHFASRLLTHRQAAHSRALARVLTALSLDNGSQVSVRVQGQTRVVTTPKEFIQALLHSGHRVEMRNERTFANFLSLTWRGRNLRWPVWIDTGVVLSDNSSFTVPSGHSHHAFRIHGPVADGRVMFYLGISGAAFFAQIDERPGWTGMRATTSVRSGYRANDREILTAVSTAGLYLSRVRLERDTVAKGLPADGYGYLGICNDSNAVLEYATRGTITAFPIVRARELLQLSPGNDGLDRIFEALPADGDVSHEEFAGSAYQKDALSRILAMMPYGVDSPALWSRELRRQFRLALEMIPTGPGGLR